MSVNLETDPIEAFQAFLEKQFQQASSADSMLKMRAKAWEYFLQLGLPTRHHEAFRYLKLRQLFSNLYTPAKRAAVSHSRIAASVLPECTHSVVVFVNGYYEPTLSDISALPKQMSISTLSDAMRPYGAFLNNQWARSIKEETDPFAMLNAALHSDGIFLYLPPKTVVDVPVQILHVTDVQETAALISPRLHVFAGTHSQIDISVSYTCLTGNIFCMNQASDIAVEEGARVRYIQTTEEMPADSWHFESVRAYLKRDSNLLTAGVSNGSAAMRYNYHVSLVGENSEASLNGVWMLNGNREAHTYVTVDHQAPNCRSMQLYKGVLNDTSKSSFEGKILVQRQAQKTDAFQLNNNLLISDRAQANSKPNLEIFADDVKASHGATVGQLDSEQLFYMKSRGFPESEAKKMLVHSFCKEVIDRIPLLSLQT